MHGCSHGSGQLRNFKTRVFAGLAPLLRSREMLMSGKLMKSLALLLLVVGTSTARACDVPVYRYAMERWPAESYQVVVFYSGALSQKQRQVVERLKRSSDTYLPYANYTVREIDLDSLTEGPMQALWESLGNPEPPRLAVRIPGSLWPEKSIWSGPVTMISAGAIIDSEARREIGRRLLSGEAATWVLVESGDREKNDAAAALLNRRLSRLKSTLKLPAAVAGASLTGAPGLRVDFSMIRLSRSDPGEELFIQMLMHAEPDLELYTSWPMAFPVYGRGRVLYALVGEGINEENIYEACAFLVGPCACEIKSLNYGFDLLMLVDWESGIGGSWVEEVGLPPLTVLSGLSPAVDQGAGTASAADSTKSRLPRNILLALGLIVIVIALWSYKVVKSNNRE